MTSARPDVSRPSSTSAAGVLARLRARTTALRERATGALPRPRWTLRRRLVALVVALVAVVAVAVGGLTTLALRGSLVAQLDDDLTGAHNRFMMWSDDGPAGTGASGSSSVGGDVVLHRVPAAAPPVGLPGQEVGTVTFAARPGRPADDVTAAYLLASGEQRVVPTEAVETLLALPHDGRIRAVDLAGVGEYRALVTVTRTGDVAVTAMPTASVTRTLTTYVLMVGIVALLAVLAAAAAGLVLVRRELRPLTRVAATAARVSRLPLDRGEVVLADRVPAADTDTGTEVGAVGAALNRLLGHVEGALGARYASESQVRQFVADASHELRTPLASIRGYAELVRRLPDDLPPEALVAMSRVESESRRMTALVEDMLLLARLDAGRPLESAPVDLAMLAVDAVTDAHAAGPDHTWCLDLSRLPDDESAGAPGALVLGDDHRLRQVLANLLSNARLHTPAGTSVTVRVARHGADVVVDVVDDGPGIPADLRDRLFERFVRGDASRNRAAGSTGLGLSIAHAVVTAHRGTLTVAPTPGGGTTFTVRLPAAPPDEAPARTTPSPVLVDA